MEIPMGKHIGAGNDRRKQQAGEPGGNTLREEVQIPRQVSCRACCRADLAAVDLVLYHRCNLAHGHKTRDRLQYL